MDKKSLPDYGMIINGELYGLVETESEDECEECALYGHCEKIREDNEESAFLCEAVLGSIHIGVNFKKWRL